MEDQFYIPSNEETKDDPYTEEGEVTTDSEAGEDTSDESDTDTENADSCPVVHSSSSDYTSSSDSEDDCERRTRRRKEVKEWFKDKYEKTKDFFMLYPEKDKCEKPPKKVCEVKSKMGPGSKTFGDVFDKSARTLLKAAIGSLMSMQEESVILPNVYGKREFNVKDLQTKIGEEMKNEDFVNIGIDVLKSFPIEAIVGFTKRFGFAKITSDKKMEEEFMKYYDNSFDVDPIGKCGGKKKKKKNGRMKIGANGKRKKVPERRRRRKPGIVIGPRRAISPYYRRRFPRRRLPPRRPLPRRIPRTKFYNPRYRNFWMYRARRNPLLRKRINLNFGSAYLWIIILAMLLAQGRYYDYQRALQGYYVNPYGPGYGIYKKIRKDVKPLRKRTKKIQSKVERKREKERKRKKLLKMMNKAKQVL